MVGFRYILIGMSRESLQNWYPWQGNFTQEPEIAFTLENKE